MSSDPFSVLGVTEDTSDAEIRRRYLALVREHSPDRAPEEFQKFRAAYEALSDERKRLAATLLQTNEAALTRLRLAALQTVPSTLARASVKTTRAVVTDGVQRAVADQNLFTEDRDHGGR
ncbi:J domain-containing protein [Paracraurococcus lichenis]|uniref:J domain-containing protein n=1 Tax=Paracraurococcus lichenis TaxID=3064888 RepID=A0ABT9EBI0_9PROT|nr:J domain-containing protein [Paracraurococcus sp. LOR1-02]MDO9713557.1 J domain-containing protein [Paracraurococcus sp. LOR1-02]